MSLTLSALSNDILLDILSHLSRKDLYNVALVSNRLSGPAHRLLYQSINLKLLFPTRASDATNDNNLHVFAQLVDTLTRNRHLQPYVSRLYVKVWMHLRQHRFGDHANLLGVLPNLQTLSLQPPPNNFQLSMLASPGIQTLHLDFSNGRDHNGDEQSSDPLEIIERVLWATHLRRFLIEGITFTSAFRKIFQAHQSRSSPVTDLQFRTCSQQEIGCLPDVLASIKALERFTFEMLTPWETSHGYAKGMEPFTFGQAVGLHAESLAHLEIASSDAAEFLRTSLFGALTGFLKLKKLAILDELLYNVSDEASSLVDVLPPNLEELQLQFAMLRMHREDPNRSLRLSRLRQLAAAKEKRFLALKRVIVWFQPCECWSNDGSCYGPLSDMDNLRVVFKKVGVKFEFLSEPYFMDTPFGGEESDRLFSWSEGEDDE
ncbi:hypothetical protein BKA64DRAFT_654628 [Cadophora sp. MPI-SDFR-AT-0126]|nr:hypothetical protein BKA64DRAFT_654628 [Leotiomycetes sp. MPI-SDFR-AT-0126]